jgi:hypothetical protein
LADNIFHLPQEDEQVDVKPERRYRQPWETIEESGFVDKEDIIGLSTSDRDAIKASSIAVA